MIIKCLAVDDEPLSLKQIGAYIKKTPFLELAALCSSALNALEYISSNQINLIFADINMPDLSGMDFVKSLKEKPYIIFTTALILSIVAVVYYEIKIRNNKNLY